MLTWSSVVLAAWLATAPSLPLVGKTTPSDGWKERAAIASVRFKRLLELGRTEPEKSVRLSAMVEQAFSNHGDPRLMAAVHKTEGAGEAFHFVLKAQSGELFDLVYLYGPDGSPLGARVDLVPKGWRIFLPSKTEQALILNVPDLGSVIFKLGAPFDPLVLDD